MERMGKSARRFISFPPAARGDGRCSFCGMERDPVRAAMIDGPGGVAICDECVSLCGEIIEKKQAAWERM